MRRLAAAAVAMASMVLLLTRARGRRRRHVGPVPPQAPPDAGVREPRRPVPAAPAGHAFVDE